MGLAFSVYFYIKKIEKIHFFLKKPEMGSMGLLHLTYKDNKEIKNMGNIFAALYLTTVVAIFKKLGDCKIVCVRMNDSLN
ncbi:hypothetical protein ODV19_04470 [Lactobacillus amylovorus]|uniref:Uncharacterized protein n=1 Tax=Lactobacillus amylovorus TaxID=1604 RepID=A0AAW6B9W4_LACAM|nr:hypothetical protein [Lactobacillus amylovorus]MDA6089264.1 hypothetical protein [Lactobacillus amylovorus]MDB6246522.1 hypothetical protein [Lactobacillus amylovorus]